MTPDQPRPPGHPAAADDGPEERDPGLARERTSLSWTRTAISFAALGGAVLKENVISGLIILAIVPIIWELGRVSAGRGPRTGFRPVGATRMFLICAAIVGMALLCLLVAIFGRSAPGALR